MLLMLLLLLLLVTRLLRLAALPEVAGCQAKLRMEGDKPYVTDNSNYIVDLYFEVSWDSSKCRCLKCDVNFLDVSSQACYTHVHVNLYFEVRR
jgi:hypothetical protein